MLILKPMVHETIWGGTRLQELADGFRGRIGHLYSVYDRGMLSNEILNGVNRGKSLHEVFQAKRWFWNMGQYSVFPLTIALVDAAEPLSIQVHPNDTAAGQTEGMVRGKRESWYFLDAPRTGWIYSGCRCDSRGRLEEILKAQKDILDAVDVLPVSSGDYVYVEPGTLHALTEGSLVYEIEEGGDLTYRVFDYERLDSRGERRPLQIGKSLRAVDVQLKSQVKRYEAGTFIAESTYETLKIDGTDKYQNGSNRIECLTILDGCCECDGMRGREGMTVLLLPGEEIVRAEFGSIMIARLRGDLT